MSHRQDKNNFYNSPFTPHQKMSSEDVRKRYIKHLPHRICPLSPGKQIILINN